MARTKVDPVLPEKWIGDMRFANFYLSVVGADFKAGLGMDCGAIQYTAIFQRKSGEVIGANDAVAFKLAF